MADRDNHYEAAFEAYLRARRLPYVAVDEARRSLAGDGTSIKNLDFIVSTPGWLTWLIDVKGRRFPSGEQKQYWKNWTSRDDLASLARWEGLFGKRFRAILVFAYWIVGDRSPLPAGQLFAHAGGLYGFVAIPLADYAPFARPISPRWDTVAMPAARFRSLARPVEHYLIAAPQHAEPARGARGLP